MTPEIVVMLIAAGRYVANLLRSILALWTDTWK